MRKKLEVNPLVVTRIALLSVAGAAQLMLVFGGCLYYLDLFKVAYPKSSFASYAIPLFAYVSLFWPLYIAAVSRASSK